MNHDRILALADFLDSGKAKGFDMSIVQHHCGVPACMAGWAIHLFTPEQSSPWLPQDAGELLAIPHDQAKALFIYTPIPYRCITPMIAAQALRRLVELDKRGEPFDMRACWDDNKHLFYQDML